MCPRATRYRSHSLDNVAGMVVVKAGATVLDVAGMIGTEAGLSVQCAAMKVQWCVPSSAGFLLPIQVSPSVVVHIC